MADNEKLNKTHERVSWTDLCNYYYEDYTVIIGISFACEQFDVDVDHLDDDDAGQDDVLSEVK